MTKKVLGITHALTDQIIPVSDEELSSIDLTCGGWKPFSICANKKSLEELLKKESVKRYLGGAPTNVIRGLNNLGYDCNLIGNIGEDELGKNYINVLFISDEESEIAFGGLQDWMFKDKICAYKKGTKGSEIYQNKNKAIIPCYKTDKLVNDNGAGDSYAAGFLHAYLENRDIELCGILASLIAKKVCQQEESWYKNNLS